VKLRHLETWTEARRSHAQVYNQLLANSGLKIPVEMPDSRHVYHIYAVLSANRDILQQQLMEKGIQTGIHYPIPVHLQKGYADLGYKLGDFPCSELAANKELSLPMYAELTDSVITYIAGVF
jgi:dTDP-4-amino-4,6-dideoxygalactose transaminase